MSSQRSLTDNPTPAEIDNIDKDEGSALLGEKLKQVARLPSDMSDEEREEHKISLAMGMVPLDSTITREELKEVLDSGRF